MPFRPPLNLDMSCKTSGTLPDGRTVPLAWDLSTGKIYMKVAPFMPWNRQDGHKAAKKLFDAGGIHVAARDEWFRGVWTEAPQQIFDADYTRKQQLELSRGGGSYQRLAINAPLGLTEGGGGMEKAGSTVIDADYEEVGDEDDQGDDAEQEEESEPVTAKGKKRKSKR